MKTTVLLLLVCLLLALPTVAQAPEKTAPDDLVVTAEIVGYKYSQPQTQAKLKRNKPDVSVPYLSLYSKMSLRNKTNKNRSVCVMTCSWENSWVDDMPYSLLAWTCDHNFPVTINIPPGEALVFYAPLFDVVRRSTSSLDSVMHFKMGFIDLMESDYNYVGSKRREVGEKRVVYWSNELSNDTRPIISPEVAAKANDHCFYLTKNGEEIRIQ